MRYVILILFIFCSLFAQIDTTTSLPEIHVSISPDELEIPSGFSQGIHFSSSDDILFYDSGNSTPDEEISANIIETYGRFLTINPNAVLTLKGFYSPDNDDILSPAIGKELAQERAKALFRIMALKFPALGDRILVSDDHNYEQSFLDSVSSYDSRVEFSIAFGRYSKRNFYPKERAPYWRDSYKQIISDIKTEMNSIFIRNPGAKAIIIGYGFPNDRQGYSWLGFLEKKIIEKIDNSFENRFLLFIDPYSQPKTPSASLLIVPEINMAGVTDFSWTEPRFVQEIACSIEGLNTLPNTFYFNVNLFDDLKLVTGSIKGDSPFISLSEVPMLGGEYRLDLHFGNQGMAMESPKLTINSTDSFSCIWNFEFPDPFFAKYAVFGGAALWKTATAIYILAKEVSGGGKISIITTADNDSAAQIKGQKIWNIIVAQISFLADTKIDKLGTWFAKYSFDVEISPTADPNENISTEDSFLKENSIQIILQRTGKTK